MGIVIEGFWVLRIQPPPITTGGVILLQNGKAFGGDGGFLWVGTYVGDGQSLRARLHVHNFDPAVQSVFGVEGDYEMHFTGRVEGEKIVGTAIIANQPQHSLGIHLERFCEL